MFRGGVTRDLLELTAWFSKVYEGNFLGLKDCWSKVSQVTMANSAGVTTFSNVESHTVSAPERLHPRAVPVPWTFYNNCSRPSLLKGLDEGQIKELLNSLAISLSNDFHVSIGVGAIPVNTVQMAGVKEPISKIVLIGASNLKKVVAHLRNIGYEVIDLCHPGWMATPASVAEVGNKLKEIAVAPNVAFVFDVFGNSVTRFELYDGTTSLPVRQDHGYHLLGDILNCSESVFSKLFEIVLPLFSMVPGSMRIILPPQPRYVFAGCCASPSHSTNCDRDSYPSERMSSFSALRAQLKKLCVPALVNNVWVGDICCWIPNCYDMNSMSKLAALRPTMAPDGVHLTPEGYRNFANYIGELLEKTSQGKLGKYAPSSSNSSLVSGSRRYHWRGFTSPVGSKSHSAGSSGLKASRGRSHKTSGPYSHNGGRGGGSWGRK